MDSYETNYNREIPTVPNCYDSQFSDGPAYIAGE